jgi:protein-S-isoprenylcysteine O-methyltransferase Ste14
VHTLRTIVYIVWAAFWLYWLVAARTAKRSTARSWRFPIFLPAVVVIVVIAREFHLGSMEVSSPVLGAIGSVLIATGLAVAIWARLTMGRNWGMPMTQKLEPELVTSGPFRFVRHPIYSGLLLALLGTGLAVNLIDVLVAIVLVGFILYITSVEERNLTAAFPTQYPAYRARTKRLIPFLL